MTSRVGGVDPARLFVAGDSPVHRCGATAKLAGLVGFVVLVAFTPRTAVPVLAADLVAVAVVVRVAGLPLRTVFARLGAIVPFVAFAFLLPFIGTGPRTEVDVGFWSVSLSVDGLWACWGILIRAVVGATAAIVVTATTPVAEVLVALRRLRVPAVMVAIVAVMLRYLEVVTAQVGRMRRAMVARGHDPRWLWQVRPVAASAGALFVRTYERGERVHLAMVARGFDGTVPPLPGPTSTAAPTAGAWAAVPATVAAVGLAAWTVLA